MTATSSLELRRNAIWHTTAELLYVTGKEVACTCMKREKATEEDGAGERICWYWYLHWYSLATTSCWSKVKLHVRQREKRNQASLIELMKFGMEQVTVDDCAGWHRHVMRTMLTCIDRQPLE